LTVARAGEDHIFHARSAQGLGRLLTQHPGDGVGNIRLAAAVGSDDGGNAIPVELEVGAVAKRFEAENLKPLQFKQRELLVKAVAIGQWLELSRIRFGLGTALAVPPASL